MSQLSHLSPVTQLSPFPATDPAQAPHLYPLSEQTFSPVHADPVILKGYLGGDMVYDIHSSLHDVCSADTSALLNHHSSFGQTEQTQDWVLPSLQHNRPGEDLMLAFDITGSPQFGPVTGLEHGHNYSGARGPIPSTPTHPHIHGQPVQLYSASHSQMQMSDYGFAYSNEMAGLYMPMNYAANSYDAFEPQGMREQSIDANSNSGFNEHMNSGMGMSAAALAGQVAF